MKNKIIIGVDLGGTKIMTGAVTPEGKVVGAPVKVLTGSSDSKELIFRRITSSIEQTIASLGLSADEIEGIGIGSTGPLDLTTGTILECPQLPSMHYFPLKEAVADHFGVKVVLNNDANCLILCESVFGAAAGKETVAGFTLGTGLGCALIFNRRIFSGATGTAAEIWPSPYQSGSIEDYVCGAGVSSIYRSLTGFSKSSLEIYDMALSGNNAALQTWNEFGQHLAVPVAWTINLIDPDIVVIGGSVATAFRFFKNSMEENLRKWICPVPAQMTKVVPASLGDHAGFIGAACLVITDN